MRYAAKVAGRNRQRRACNLGIQGDAPRTHIARTVPWNNDGVGLLHGARPNGSTEPAAMTTQEKRMIDAWDNTGGTGHTVAWVKGRTKLRRMPAKKYSAKYDGPCTNVGPVQPIIVEAETDRNLTYNDAVQHGIVVE